MEFLQFEEPFVPWILSDTLSLHPLICRHMLWKCIPFSKVKSTLKLSYWLPVTRRSLEPIPTAFTGWVPVNQFITSRLCICCSTIWSPESHVQLTQSRIIHSISVHFGLLSRCQSLPPFQ